MDPLLTTQEVAQHLGVSPTTVRREAERGKLKRLKVGRNDRYRPADVEEYMKAQEVEPLPLGRAATFAPKVKYTPGMKLVRA